MKNFIQDQTYIITIDGEEQEITFKRKHNDIDGDYDVILKKTKVFDTYPDTLFLTGNSLTSLDCYSEPEKIACHVFKVALSQTNGVAYLKKDGDLFYYNGIRHVFIANTVTHLDFCGNILYYISDNKLCRSIHLNESHSVIAKEVYDFTCGPDAIMYLSKNTLYAYGNGMYGKLGDGDVSNHMVEEPQFIAKDVRNMSMGPNHGVFVTNTSELYGIGYASDGRLGDYKRDIHSILKPVKILVNVFKAFAYESYTMYISNDKREQYKYQLYGLGYSELGIMNNGERKATLYLAKIKVCKNISDVKSTYGHILLKNSVNDNLTMLGRSIHNKDLKGTNETRIHLEETLIAKNVRDFDCNRSNIAFIVK